MNQESFNQRKSPRVVTNCYALVSSRFYLCQSVKSILITCICSIKQFLFLNACVNGLGFWPSKPCRERILLENGLYLLFSDAEREIPMYLGKIWTTMFFSKFNKEIGYAWKIWQTLWAFLSSAFKQLCDVPRLNRALTGEQLHVCSQIWALSEVIVKPAMFSS